MSGAVRLVTVVLRSLRKQEETFVGTRSLQCVKGELRHTRPQGEHWDPHQGLCLLIFLLLNVDTDIIPLIFMLFMYQSRAVSPASSGDKRHPPPILSQNQRGTTENSRLPGLFQDTKPRRCGFSDKLGTFETAKLFPRPPPNSDVFFRKPQGVQAAATAPVRK